MKGNVLVGQSGGPTAVINASLAGVYSAAKRLGADKVFGMRHGIQGLLQGDYVDMDDYVKNETDLELLKRTPSAFLGSCRFKLPRIENDREIFEKLFRQIEEMEISYFFYIGGNDSMDTIDQLARFAAEKNSDIRFIGVPKTIDNDLVCTDHTPGFGSAAKFVAASTKELIRDNKVNDQKVVTVIEVMGRDAGWLTGSTALCRGADCEGPDLIYLPEIPFDVDDFLHSIVELQKTHRAVVAVVSEGIRSKDGQYVCEYSASAKSIDAFGHKQLTGTARVLADLVNEKTGSKVRAIEFSSLQRCAAHLASLTDQTEAFMAGNAAVEAANQGLTGKFVTLLRKNDNPYICETGICNVSEVANLKKDVPREWINEEGNYVTKEFIDYVMPLIQGEVEPIMLDGLPRHIPHISQLSKQE